MSALLELHDVSMVFTSKKSLFSKEKNIGAVVGVNLQLNPGEILAVVGESGCGKTTLGKIITGLYRPTSGEIKFEGKNIWKMDGRSFKEYRRSVQMVHQDSFAALNPARTIFQSLKDVLIRHKLAKNSKEARNQLYELLKLVELTPPEQFLDKYPHQLSGGQRQRLLLARAISVKPKLIVADEPVSMVDVSLRISLLNLMTNMNKQLGIAFVYITHDLATARYIASNGRIAVMYLGKIVETGKLNEVLRNPSHPYLQALLSAVPIPDPDLARTIKALPLKSLDMPNPANPPAGCRFNPRCPYAESICMNKEPQLREINGSMVACHLVEKVPKWEMMQESAYVK